MTKKLVSIRLLTTKEISGMNLKTFPQLLDKSCQYRKEDFKNKIIHVLKRVHYPQYASSNVLHSSSLVLKVIWRCSTSLLHYMVFIIWFSLYGFSIIIWFPLYGFSIIIWFHYMVSQSLYGFSIIIWFHYMVSQSKFGKLYVSKSDKCVQPLIPANVHQPLIPAV